MQQSKLRYEYLDALRGVVAIFVVVYHFYEAIFFAPGQNGMYQTMFNGFLGVDFFFVLSGFVMGYAYDKRWATMSVGKFIKLRLTRLHPMVVAGAVIGLVAFIAQGAESWYGDKASWGQILLSFMLALLLIPSLWNTTDVRGNTEIYPLNGPHWSLFFEYIGSLAYALLLRNLSTRWLKIWVAVSGIALLAFGLTMPDGTLGFGWSRETMNMLGGLLRLSFSYPMGLLLSRMYKPSASGNSLRRAILLTALLAGALFMPSLKAESGWVYADVVYQWLAITAVFPAIVWFGASVRTEGVAQTVANYLGRLSYPLYSVHYPFIYLFAYWLGIGAMPFGLSVLQMSVLIMIASIATAVVCLHWWDEPIRKRLSDNLRSKL